MYEKKVGKAYLRGCLRQLVVMAVGAILGSALVGSVLVLVGDGDIEPRGPRFTLALALPAIFILSLLTIGAVWVWIRARRLDRAFVPWRLRGQQAGAVMRSWHGEIEGRTFNAWFYRGPTIELYLGCVPATRGAIHRGGALIRAVERALGSREPLAPSPLDLDGVSVYADDPAWMHRLLGRNEAREAVTGLLRETPRAAAGVTVAPNAVRYVRRFQPLTEMSADNMRRWVGQLGILAAAADAIGPSADRLEPSRLEEWARTARGRYLRWIFLGLGLFLLLTLAALFVFSWFFVGQS